MTSADKKIKQRLEHLRGELRDERISWGELAELQSLAAHIDPGDAELLEAAGVPEDPEERARYMKDLESTPGHGDKGLPNVARACAKGRGKRR